ncbi:hypothetical protein ASE63_23465 [Bosea sp. Root381]|uniref:rhodanese-like domain-containing protein n=1 Tax=Bosea sp. Root381 TaxID=1736524 RepID=UPI0006FD0336|nr:rhodanese-like domain-containing protein [Bosea sp. Root381]KRE06915.1 hypothetical protein ASE63_23465 [Bosea sp. Root381]
MSSFTPAAPATIDPHTLLQWLRDGGEIALIDIREEGLFGERHLLLAANIPYSRLELDIQALVPRPATRIVLVAEPAIGPLALRRLAALGYGDVHLLEGGFEAWQAAGQPVFAGVNVPSKAFAEYVEVTLHTPDIEAAELDRLRQEGADLIVIDTRTSDEFARFHVPGAVSAPGAEIVQRFAELVPSAETTVVVSCAGRTRGIIGGQALINAGVPNPVRVLSGGTQGWRLAGFALERDSPAVPRSPLAESARAKAQARAATLASRHAVPEIDTAELARLRGEADRTTYLFDVRSPEEYATGHAEGFVSAQGGQLVQALDSWAATRGARIVLTDDDGVRARVTAHWLRQLGWDAVVLPGFVEGKAPTSAHPEPARPPAPTVLTAAELREWLGVGAALLSADRSGDHRRNRPARAGWVNRSRLDQLPQEVAAAPRLVVTAADAGLAALVALDLAEARRVPVAIYPGGEESWRQAGLALSGAGDEPRDAKRIDYLFWLHDRHSGNLASSRAYLDWELGLPSAVGGPDSTGFSIAAPPQARAAE